MFISAKSLRTSANKNKPKQKAKFPGKTPKTSLADLIRMALTENIGSQDRRTEVLWNVKIMNNGVNQEY